MLLRWEWINLRFALDKIKFNDKPIEFLENTFPTKSIVLIMIALLIGIYLLSR